MGHPVVTFPDAGAVLANAIRTALASRVDDVAVGTRIDGGRDRAATYIACVADIPPTMQGRAMKRQGVRIIVWDADRDRALDVAELAHAFAVAHIGGGIRSVIPDTPPYVDADPDTGEPMAAATVTANLAPVDVI